MPFVRSADSTDYEIHGARFRAYAHSGTGATQLAAWITEIPARTTGATHRVDREEVLRLVTGRIQITIDGECADLGPGDIAIVPPGGEIRADNITDEPAAMWATTTVGLSAALADGSTIRPPWAS